VPATTPPWSLTGALISDRLREVQIPKGFLLQSMFTAAGAALANASLFIF
jgi:maltose/moltooligosaccharide transporter